MPWYSRDSNDKVEPEEEDFQENISKFGTTYKNVKVQKMVEFAYLIPGLDEAGKLFDNIIGFIYVLK